MYNVLITGKLAPIAIDIFRKEPDILIDYRPDLPLADIIEIIRDADALVSRSETTIDRELIDRAERLKVIARAAVGVGNIDIDYATERGILVMNTPGMNTNSAAELTLGLLLAAMRKIVLAHESMSHNAWDRHRFSGRELRGKTIGIIGLGNVGHRVARFSRGFDMKVLAYDPYLTPAVFEQHQATRVSLEELCRAADIITVHVPKNRETTGMIGRTQLSLTRPGVIVLNAARGGIIDEAALLEALRSGQVAAAGIDTWNDEPPTGNPFASLANVVMTPHIGASTFEAQDAIGQSVAHQTVRALRGEVVDFPVNMPQMKVIETSLTRKFTVLAGRLGRFAAQFADFPASRIDVLYRGTLSPDDAALCKLAFLKAILQESSDDLVTYVNAERRAQARGLTIEESIDRDYTDYESSIRFILHGDVGRKSAVNGNNAPLRLELAGVVFSGGIIRITKVNDFVVEMEPAGTLLVTTNIDRPGMIGVIGTVLGSHSVNIDQFELARNRPGGEAMALIRVDDEVNDSVLEKLRLQPGITSVRRIRV